MIGPVILGLSAESSFAEEAKTFNLGAVVGFPQMLGVKLDYLGLPALVPGISFGAAPIDGPLNRAVKLHPIPIHLNLPDSYTVSPSAGFSLYSFGADLKYFPQQTGLFFDFSFSSVTFGASIHGDLVNTTAKKTFNSVITGSGTLTQLILGLSVGYHCRIFNDFFIEGALGAGYLLPPIYSVTVGGSLTDALGVVPGGQQELDDAKAEIQSEFDSAVATYRAKIRVVPTIAIGVGFTF